MHASSPRRALFSLSDSASRVMSRTAAIACLALTLAACGGGGGNGANFAGTPAGSVTTTPSTGTGTSTGGSTTAPPTPVYSIGNGSGSGFKDGIVDTNKTTLESGDTATLRVNVVDQATNPPATDLGVSFASTCSSSGLATFGAISQVTRGLFSVDYINSGCDRAEDVVTATLTANGDQASTKIRMVGPEVLSVSFVSATFTQLALAGIGGNESSELVFKVVGQQGVPVIGKTVDFSISTKAGGASIMTGRTFGTTDQAGQVRTVITSGTIAGPINVLAVERATGKQGLSPDIVISSGVPASRFFSLSQSTFTPKDAFRKDGVDVTVSIIASDTFGNNPTDGTRVTFVSPESGNIGSSCLLSNGACSVVWRSSSPRPPNGRATILAYTNGAEDFRDNNGNSVFDASDTFLLPEPGEPYADENESGGYEIGEYFFDANKNSIRDGGNGKWDGPCLSKVDSRAVCTGDPNVTIYDMGFILYSTNTAAVSAPGNFPPVGEPINIQQGTTRRLVNLFLSDDSGINPLPNDSSVAFSIDGVGATLSGSTNYVVPSATAPTGPYGIDLVATAVTTGTMPKGISLVLTVSAGEAPQKLIWPVNVTP